MWCWRCDVLVVWTWFLLVSVVFSIMRMSRRVNCRLHEAASCHVDRRKQREDLSWLCFSSQVFFFLTKYLHFHLIRILVNLLSLALFAGVCVVLFVLCWYIPADLPTSRFVWSRARPLRALVCRANVSFHEFCFVFSPKSAWPQRSVFSPTFFSGSLVGYIFWNQTDNALSYERCGKMQLSSFQASRSSWDGNLKSPKRRKGQPAHLSTCPNSATIAQCTSPS